LTTKATTQSYRLQPAKASRVTTYRRSVAATPDPLSLHGELFCKYLIVLVAFVGKSFAETITCIRLHYSTDNSQETGVDELSENLFFEYFVLYTVLQLLCVQQCPLMLQN